MSNTNKITRIVGCIAALVASVLMIIVANMLIAKFTPDYGKSDDINALVIISYIMIVVAVLSKISSLFLIGGVYRKPMAAGLIITQLVLMALEITTIVLWTGMGNVIGGLDITFMIVSGISIILAIAYLIGAARDGE